MRVVDAVVLDGSQCLALAVTFERMLQRDPTLASAIDPTTRDLLRDVNDAALGERRRRLEDDWQAGLVPIRVAAERLDVSERTVRRWAATGRVAAVRADRGWLVDVSTTATTSVAA